MNTLLLQPYARWGATNDMNTPPNPPSPVDAEAYIRLIARLQKRVEIRLRTRFPGLPY